MKKGIYFLLSLTLLLALAAPASAISYTSFVTTSVGGGPITASAIATITSGSGYVDVILQNTSDLGPWIDPSGNANPFITEIEYILPVGYVTDTGNSKVQSFADTWFAQGAGNAASQLGVMDLAYNIVAADTPGMSACFMTSGGTVEADNIRNDNTIASINVLDGSNIPQEGWANGFLNTSPNVTSGTVFDSALFHFEFTAGDTAALESFWATPGNLVLKFVGGGDYSEHVYNTVIPEPASILLLGSGLAGLIGLRRKFK